MKIAFYINAIHEGGAERVMVNLASNFADSGNKIILITSFKDDWEYPYSNNIKRYNLEKSKNNCSKIRRNYLRIKKLRKILKLESPDCIISFMAEPNYRAIIATIGLKTKVIISIRNDPNKEYSGIIGKILGKKLLPLADGCVFQTKEAQKWFPMKLQKKSKIIYNAVKKDFFEIKRNIVKNRIVTCGRLEPQKNHKMLINAFTIVLKQHPQAKLFIYGEGKSKEELSTVISNNNIKRNVFLCGNSNNIPEVLKTAELFVLSSDFEGMPNALMEAMAAGIACVSTDCPCGGPRELIKDKYNGYLVPVNDSTKMANTIINALNNPKKTIEIGTQAKSDAYNYFFPEKIIKEWYEYIKNIVKNVE